MKGGKREERRGEKNGPSSEMLDKQARNYEGSSFFSLWPLVRVLGKSSPSKAVPRVQLPQHLTMGTDVRTDGQQLQPVVTLFGQQHFYVGDLPVVLRE